MQERIATADQLTFKRAIAEHLGVEDGLGDVILGLRVVRMAGRFALEPGERLRVLEIVEMLKALRNFLGPGDACRGSHQEYDRPHASL